MKKPGIADKIKAYLGLDQPDIYMSLLLLLQAYTIFNYTYKCYKCIFKWRDKYLIDLGGFLGSVISAEGTTHIDLSDTQTVHIGQYFSSLGPEIFLDFMKYESTVMSTHCVIIQNTVRFGKEMPITIKGEYIDWLVYFAEYKKALISLAQYKRHNVAPRNEENLPEKEKMLVSTPTADGKSK